MKGSRRSVISSLKPGQSAVFEAPGEGGGAFMQQISTDIQRLGVPATLELLLAVPTKKPRRVYEIVRVTRKAES